MSRSRLTFFLFSLALLLPLVLGVFVVNAATGDEEDSLYKYLSVFTEVLSLVSQAYVEETSIDGLMAGALDGAVDALDSFSSYIPPDKVESYLASRRTGSLHSGLKVARERGIAFAAAVEPGGPAARGGIESGDIIARLQGRSTRRMPLWEIQEILAGEPGTGVEVEILRQGNSRELSLTLGRFQAPPAEIEEIEEAVLLRLPSIAPGSGPVVRGLLEELNRGGEDKLLVDLRGAVGGDPASAYEIGALFVRGPLGELRGRSGTLERFTGEEAPVWSGELVVLTDRSTFGAAEVVAATLRQGAGAEIVGQRTFGFAGRQELVRLSNGGRLLLTDAFFTGPDGAPIVDSLEPDLVVDEASRSFGEQELPLRDLILERGLELLRGRVEAPRKKAA